MKQSIPKNFSIKPIGFIRSEITQRKDAARSTAKGAPDVILEILPAYRDGLDRVQVGDEIIVITWLHQAHRDVLKVYPRGDTANPLTGVFLTRSPDRPNPIGLHRTKVLSIHPDCLHIGPMEAIDGTPVIDIKPVMGANDF
jgi:tRNA-Thr(GGU) m(6)t(6)A37 methyltransferase TsaA